MKLTSIIYSIIILALVSFRPIMQTAEHDLLEKIYTQTDRPLYFPGETIWFKSYITNGENKITTISDIMYAELISPKGTIAHSILLPVNQGYAYGDFHIDNNWAGGIYKLRTYTNWMRNFGKESFFEKEIIVQKAINPNLLMTLDFDKEAYGKNSEVIAYFDVKDLENNALSNADIQYTVFIKGEKYKKGNTTTDRNGKINITFSLPENLNTTDALLNIVVPYKSSAESISRSIPVTLDKIDLQFFPESGSAILNMENKIAFKAINEFGKPADVSGKIIDSLGNTKVLFKSYHDGMGSFNFIPEDNNTYYAKITTPFESDSLIKLPAAKRSGTKFTVIKEKDYYKFDIFSNKDSLITIQITGASKQIVNEKKYLRHNKVRFKVKAKDLPTGIVKASILNTNGDIVAERLLFVNRSNQLKIDVSLDKENYSSREKVKVTIKTTNQDNKPIPANLSVSIADNRLVSLADDKQDNILSYLLMSSELQGKIHEPTFYFDDNEEKATKALDFVMLTHGWRKYISNDEITLKNAAFLPDRSTIQTGKIVDKGFKPVKAHLLLFDQYSNKVLKFDSDNNGKYSFKIGHTNSNYVLLAYTDNNKKIKIIKDKITSGTINKNLNDKTESRLKSDIKNLDITNPLNKTIKENVISKSNLGLQLSSDNNSLDEVVVVGYGVEDKRTLSGAVSTIVSGDISKINSDDVRQLLQGRVAGLLITSNSSLPGNNTSISIRGSNSIHGNSQPLIVVDGVPIDQNVVNNSLSNLEPDNIDDIHVLKGAAASAIYGSSGINGVIVISTKNQNFQHYGYKSLNNRKYKNYAIETFHSNNKINTYKSREFYIPVYANKEESSTRNDFRQTIYWNPVVQTDENGEASFEFYNSDALTTFIITTEGIGYNGLTGRDETTYSTRKNLNVEFKTPAFFVLHDTINLPVVISNNTKNAITSTLKIQLPDEFKLIEEYNDTLITIKPHSNIVKSLNLVPVKKSEKTTIEVAIKGNKYKDNIQKEVAIISPYFPTEVSVSGFKDNSYEFKTNNVVEGSLKADLTVYVDIVGDVMDGIESLIRQPYGCFEQVSSVTYPNVLILKYLKETNKSNPEVEKRAMDYIINGYKKLAAYETKENGFEWYGHTPPHEALSAYGLMEFMEMKSVYDGVSDPMIKRTVNFLLSRKDGKGGFKQNRGKYGFSGAPEDVNNAYIVYAISEVGIDADIEKEYNYSFNDALESNDSYKLALMAAASLNINKEKNAEIILKKIKDNIEKYSFKALPAKNTITYSYGNSKHVETAAFTILALLKENKSPILINQGIEYLISQRKNGGFGSTQATSMALKALIEYTKNQKQRVLTRKDFVSISINRKKVNKQIKLTADGKLVINGLEAFITQGKQEVTVNFSNSENTFPYLFHVTWDSKVPNASPECKVKLTTNVSGTNFKVGDIVRMNIKVNNITSSALPMVTAIIGIPSGASLQTWQLKEISEQHKVDYLEIFDNYLVLYWKEFNAAEEKELQLDLKAEIPGNYQAPASTTYLYYTDEFKHWIAGNRITINN